MEPLARHFGPEDEIIFAPPLPLAPMSFRAKWWLGIKLVVCIQILWFPFTFLFRLTELIDVHAPDFANSSTWAFLALVLHLLCFVFGPLWAAALFRHFVAGAYGQKFLREIVVPASGAEREDKRQ